MNDNLERTKARLACRHQAIGWCGLFVFVCLGIVLETLHGFKTGYYLDPAFRLRRLLWTLAHAHGTLIALVHVAFAVSLRGLGGWTETRLKLASFFLLDALLFLPAGFFLGGIGLSEHDPSLGILLVPVGAFVLLAGIGLVAWTAIQGPGPEHPG